MPVIENCLTLLQIVKLEDDFAHAGTVKSYSASANLNKAIKFRPAFCHTVHNSTFLFPYWKLTGIHLNQQDSKAVHIHLGWPLLNIKTFRGHIGFKLWHTANISVKSNTLKVTNLSFPVIVWVKEHIATAEPTMHIRIGKLGMQVEEALCHIRANGL